ncbi:MAG: hypothetical protein RMJ84_08110 [Sandaracinaceae bacterium]|nr:hypothetical protein [Sandaracinaceae bacterium]
MHSDESSAVARLRQMVEEALAASRSRKVVEPLLERLLSMAPPGSHAALLAHRVLAEYRLFEHPWRALLHLRQVLKAHPEDDAAYAMQGVAHVASGNLYAAAASFRRALQLAPHNPWYHHNYGHLLDVAFNQPLRALPHLKQAYAHEGKKEAEVALSYLSCLFRASMEEPKLRDEALKVLEEALAFHPSHHGIRALARSIRMPSAQAQGQPPHGTTRSAQRKRHAKTTSTKPLPDGEFKKYEEQVLALLRTKIGQEGVLWEAANDLWKRLAPPSNAQGIALPLDAPLVAAALHRCASIGRTPKPSFASLGRLYGIPPRRIARLVHQIEEYVSKQG